MTETASQPEPHEPTTSATTPSVSEGLPEDFELTPELVEEEAIRGDFVLRWAAVLLAVLVASTVITHTAVLVEVKAGQYLVSNGILPDGTDPFSYTTEGRVWRNHAWLYDLLLAGVYGLSGSIGLTVFKALLAGVTFWCVVTISRPNTPTWWNAINCAIGAFACIPFFTGRPESVTLVGCAVLLKLLHAWRYRPDSRIPFAIVALFLIWSNLDPRMFLGLLMLIVFALGESLRKQVRPESPLMPKRMLWKIVGLSVVATLINPFGYHALLSAWETYGVVDPAFRDYYGSLTLRPERLYYFNLLQEAWWDPLTIPFLAALIVGGLAVIALYLNYTGLNPSHILLLLVFMGLAFATGREIGPAVIVCCMIGNLNCQDWYRESFTQTYSVKTSELLFSRGGRAVTVLSFLGLAYLAVSGRAYEFYETYVGFGFENRLDSSLAGMTEELRESFDDRPFNFTISQGDTLIWAGQRVFIDSRLGLYVGEGENDLIALHNTTRQAMRLGREGMEGTGKPEIWKPVLDKYSVTHALPRIVGEAPDYLTYNDLMAAPEWRLTHLGPAVASFYRSDIEDEQLKAYFETHRINFTEDAFGAEQELKLVETTRVVFPNPATAYEKYLTARRETIPAKLTLAGHYAQHLEQATAGFYVLDVKTELAFAYLSIRNLNLALAENPESASGFRVLGQLYYYLGLRERQYAQSYQFRYDSAIRYFQSILALKQSLICDPESVFAVRLLRDQFAAQGRLELAKQSALRLDDLFREQSNAGFDPQLIEENLKLLEELNKQLAPILEAAEKQKQEGSHPFAVASELSNRGCHVSALALLDEHPEYRQTPSEEFPQLQMQAQFLWGALQLEHGNAEEAYNTLLKMEPMLESSADYDGFRLCAMAAAGHADYTQAIAMRRQMMRIRQQMGLAQIIGTLPLMGDAEIHLLQQAQAFTQYQNTVEESLAENLWWMAVYELERGQNSQAIDYLHQALEVAPESSLRPLVGMYLAAVANEEIDFRPPSDQIPITPETFAEDPDGKTIPRPETTESAKEPEPGNDAGTGPLEATKPATTND